MDFELSEAQQLLRNTMREFARREVAPIAAEIDREDRWPGELWPKLGELGVLGITVPEEYGGSGADLLSGVLTIEELGKVSASVALSYGAHANLCANNIASNANEELKRRYLPALCDGSRVGALALTEPEAGSDAVGLRTTARREGDVYVLNGRKMFITNGSVAGTLVLYAKTEPEAGSRGITAFIVESDFPGFRVGQHLDKVGHRGSPTSELLLDDCQVPTSNVVGELNGGVEVMMQGLAVERVFLAGESLGIGEAALEASVKYAREREQFGERDRQLPAHPGKVGRHVYPGGGGALAAVSHGGGRGGGVEGERRAGQQGGRGSDPVRGGDVDAGGGVGRADPRGLRLLERRPGVAISARCEVAGDWRRDE